MSELEQAVEILSGTRKAVAFTGAGVSAESGIATYRDPGGLWDRYGNQGMLNVLAAYPEMAPQILGDFFSRLQNARPNAAHHALAELENQGRIAAVITQNVDDLHREAGSRTIYALHGSLFRLRCMQCNAKRSLSRQELFEITEKAIAGITGRPYQEFSLEAFAQYFPRCSCEGMTRLDFVSFGESVQDFAGASLATRTCDAMLIIGTSGVVYPAASLPESAKAKGARLIEVNPGDTELSRICDVIVRGPAAETMARIMRKLEKCDSGQK